MPLVIDDYERRNRKTRTRDKSPQRKNAYYPELPQLESWIYVILWISGHVWTISSVFYRSKEKAANYFNNELLDQGWHKYLGRYKDTTNFEWAFWDKFLMEAVVIGLSGHFLTARIADAFCPNYRFKVFLAYSFVFTVNFLGLHGVVLMLTHFTIQYLAAVLSKNIIVCWMTGLGLVYTLANKTCVNYVKTYYEDYEKAYFLLFSIAMCNLRYIAFSLEYVWSVKKPMEEATGNGTNIEETERKKNGRDLPKGGLRQRKQEANLHPPDQKNQPHSKGSDDETMTFSFLDLLEYQMYFPLFYGGPILNYNDFAAQKKRPPLRWNWQNTINFTLGMLRYVYWHLFIQFTLHFMYFGAMDGDYKFLRTTSLRVLSGLTLCHVYFFYLKYLVMYGMPAHFAVSDNLTVPGAPHCVASKHRVTDMWKYFDKGLHKWLVRYIYVPCRGTERDVPFIRMTISSFLPFVFTCYWHGASKPQMYWAFLSWVGVYVESLALKFYRTKRVQDFEWKYLTRQWSRRLRALLSCFMFGVLILTNIYFLSGVYVANLHIKRLYTEDIVATVLIHIALYFGVQTSMDLENLGY